MTLRKLLRDIASTIIQYSKKLPLEADNKKLLRQIYRKSAQERHQELHGLIAKSSDSIHHQTHLHYCLFIIDNIQPLLDLPTVLQKKEQTYITKTLYAFFNHYRELVETLDSRELAATASSLQGVEARFILCGLVGKTGNLTQLGNYLENFLFRINTNINPLCIELSLRQLVHEHIAMKKLQLTISAQNALLMKTYGLIAAERQGLENISVSTKIQEAPITLKAPEKFSLFPSIKPHASQLKLPEWVELDPLSSDSEPEEQKPSSFMPGNNME